MKTPPLNVRWSGNCLLVLLLLITLQCSLVAGFTTPASLLSQTKKRFAAIPRQLQEPENLDHEHDEYSKCLSPSEEKAQIHRENDALEYDEGPRWRRRLVRPIRAARRKLFPQDNKPGHLILIKCGESNWKKRGIFTGWSNAANLTPQGEQECRHAARLLLEAGYQPDLVYTSMLNRAIQSVWIINKEMDSVFLPSYKSWRLNERMYGSIQGLNKKECAKIFGRDVVQAWRHSFKARPPPMSKTDRSYPGNDRRYANLDPDLLSGSESLEDCMKRQQPLWKYRIAPELKKGNNVLVVGHFSSLQGLVKIIDDVKDNQICDVTFPPGIPFVYKFDSNMQPIPPEDAELAQKHTSGVFLEKPGLLKEALQRQAEWQASVPGAEGIELASNVKRMTTVEESLMLLKKEQEMEEWAASHRKHKHKLEIFRPRITKVEGISLGHEIDDCEFEESTHAVDPNDRPVVPNVGQFNVDKDPVVVLVRHGTTPHNELALFTGWEDPPLSDQGVDDAIEAGKLLKRNGFEFDVVYTSWLGRAIETAWLILGELDQQWLPLIKSWRLNERHYGDLTGKSKKMIGNLYGQEQLKKWRRGFNIPPPKSSSYSFSYPGNDYRRAKYVKDLRISLTETICRSIEGRKFQIHRKFPKSESLKMCMDRSIPFYTQKIVPEAVAKGKRVLITSHENAIRGILMHLCEIPKDCMNDLHLPNGLPLIYNVRRKCISLLDDGTGRDPMEVHDFGSAAQYLFRPCEITEEDFERIDADASHFGDDLEPKKFISDEVTAVDSTERIGNLVN